MKNSALTPHSQPSPHVLLELNDVSMLFGGLKAIDSLSFSIHRGELVGLIGPNGAGKTTCFNVMTGVYKPTSGTVSVLGINTASLSPWQISQIGLSRTFQNIRLFRDLTVLDNVLVAALQHQRTSLWAALAATPRSLIEADQLKERALELLDFFDLSDKADELSSGLSYGECRKLEIVRALATEPHLILLDEPAAGMNHRETEDLMGLIAQLRKEFSLSVMLIEHDMKLVMGICERIVVLDHGTLIAEGTPSGIKSNPVVIEAYLGNDKTTPSPSEKVQP